MYELCRYDLSNDSLIDIKNIEENNFSVANHENIHRILCGTSSYGLLIIMMKKNEFVEDSHNWLMDSLVNNMLRMQETLATTIEHFIIHREQGEKEYEKRIEELKNNKTYYNYFRRLFFSNMELDDDKIIDKLLSIGIYSLNIDLYKIPFEDFKNEKDFQRFLTKEGNNLRFLPNRRFEILFSLMFRDVELDEIEQELKYIHEGTIQFDDDSDIVKCARETYKIIYSESVMFNALVSRINGIDMHRHRIYEGVSKEYMYSYPIDLNNRMDNTYKINILDCDKFWDKFDEFNKEEVVIRFEHLLGGFEYIGAISLWDLKNSNIYSTLYDIRLFDECIQRSNCKIIFIQSKLFQKMKYKIRGMAYSLPVYLFMDGAIINQIEFILKHFKDGNYTYFTNEEYVTLIIFRGSYVLIQFIIPNLVGELDNLLFRTSNIRFIKYEETSLDKKFLSKISEESMKYTNYNFN